MVRADSRKGANWWTWIELIALLIGAAGSAAACLASYQWHWFQESLFFTAWSAAPYGLLLLGGIAARRLVRSLFLRLVTALLAIGMTFLSLWAYIGAVLRPNHSSGMVFAVLPLIWMMAILVILAVFVVGLLVAKRCSDSGKEPE